MQKITFIDKMNILRDNSINPARMFNHQNNHPFMKYITSSFWIDIRILFQIYSPPTTARKRSISESLEKKYSSDPDWRLAGRVVCPPLSGNRLPWIRRRDSKTSATNHRARIVLSRGFTASDESPRGGGSPRDRQVTQEALRSGCIIPNHLFIPDRLIGALYK